MIFVYRMSFWAILKVFAGEVRVLINCIFLSIVYILINCFFLSVVFSYQLYVLINLISIVYTWFNIYNNFYREY